MDRNCWYQPECFMIFLQADADPNRPEQWKYLELAPGDRTRPRVALFPIHTPDRIEDEIVMRMGGVYPLVRIQIKTISVDPSAANEPPQQSVY